MSTLPNSPAVSPQLRLFLPASATTPPPPIKGPQCDLDTVFERLVLPELTGHARDTVAEYQLHLRRLRQFWEELRGTEEGADAGKERILDPLLLASSKPTLAAMEKPLLLRFRAWVAQGYSPRTANKHLGTVLAVMRAAEDERWIERVPRLRPMPWKKAAEKRYLSYEELSTLYDGCGAATWPRGLPHAPADYWRALVVLWFNFGLRTQEAVRHSSSMSALRRCDVIWTPRFQGDGAPRIDNPLGWLRYVPQKQRRLKPEPLVLPLNEALHAHLRSIESPGGPEDPLFPFPLSSDQFYSTWDAICEAGGEPWKIQHLRKTCETWHNYYRRGIAPYITGHAERTTSAIHYDNVERSVQAAMLTFLQPDAFVAGLATGISDRRVYLARDARQQPEMQLRLF